MTTVYVPGVGEKWVTWRLIGQQNKNFCPVVTMGILIITVGGLQTQSETKLPKSTFVNCRSTISRKPFFTVWTLKIDSWSIWNEAIVVSVWVFVKICWTSDTLIVRHIIGNQTPANDILFRVWHLVRHPVEVSTNTLCRITDRTFLHVTRLATPPDKKMPR